MSVEYSVKSGSPEKQRSACIIIPIFKERKLSRPAQTLDKASGGMLKQFLKRGDINGEMGEFAWIYDLENSFSDRVLLIGCGAERELGFKHFKKVCHQAADILNKSGATEAVSYLSAIDFRQLDQNTMVRETVLSFENALYRFNEYKSDPAKVRKPLRKLTIGITRRKDFTAAEEAMLQGKGIATGMSLAKDLANSPPNICHPEYLAQRAKQLSKTYRKLKVNIIEEKEMEALGMGAFLSVSRGSEQPAKLICMEYNASKDSNSKPIVLVGKGITFDSGGISIKPSPAMDEMKYDMGGAASVFGALAACMHMQLPVHVIAVVAAAENMPDGRASRPGDIVTTLSGQTVEILNTDAEGRLVLCDTLTYVKKFDPEVVIDVATLTGACIMALGHHASGMLTNKASLGRELAQAGNAIDDRLWELPLWDDYAEQLQSNFADMANIGGRPAGTITAAAFLSKFTQDYPWAHLDIAGTAWISGKDKAATGRPVPLLTEFILQRLQQV
jgi:leucyl aminopeptidase